jgi:hypothetical protein
VDPLEEIIHILHIRITLLLTGVLWGELWGFDVIMVFGKNTEVVFCRNRSISVENRHEIGRLLSKIGIKSADFCRKSA